MKPVIEFKNFTFQYLAQSEPTLHDINLTINAGEKVLIIGPSGSGKSTLTACINGLIPHSFQGQVTGELLINGENVLDQSIFERSKNVGTVLQDPDGQFIGLTVGEDIVFSLENDCVPFEEMQARVQAASRLVNMQNFLSHEPHALSGGQKQRVGLAGVLIDAVNILLFDEPLANLDPAAGREAIALIDQVTRENATTTIIVEHRLEDVLYRHVDRIVLISDGRLALDASADEVLASDLVVKNGIREPLYLAALRYAGIGITSEMHPDSLEHLQLSDAQKSAEKNWFSNWDEDLEWTEHEKLLSVSHLNFQYEAGKKVLNDINFDIEEGEFVAIVGENGAGKSTLSKLICGFEKLSEGSITWRGKDLSALTITERAEHIGYVMQNPNQMISKAMIFDEVALGLRSRGVSEEDIKTRVDETLKICGLYEFRNWPISALSFGQKKRVTIASILALEPELLILDEPTAGQDYRHYTEIMSFLESLNARGITIVIITHDMHLMLEYAKRVLVFDEHQLLRDARPEEVLTDADLLQRAHLKETSLYDLASLCGISDGTGFIRHFIDVERKKRQAHG